MSADDFNPTPHNELAEKIGKFPKLPGVYLMRDGAGEVIYIGKAKELRTRVRSYFRGGDERVQIPFLIRKVVDIEVTVTESEQQAFILERDLIAKYKPRYNIRLKDDKSYLSIRIDERAPWPRVEVVRRVSDDGARYFGPYSFSYELRSMTETLKRVVPLRSCSNTVFFNRTRPCLEYDMKRCAGPCCLPVEPEQYREWVEQAIDILEGRTDKARKVLEAQMERASQELRFEDAAVIRDRIAILERVASAQQMISPRAEDRDVVAIHRQGELAALAVLIVRRGRVQESVTYTLHDVVLPTSAVLEATLSQFYERRKEIPEEIIVPELPDNEELLTTLLSELRGKPVALTVPQRGLKYRLLQLAELNASQHFASLFDEERRYDGVARKLAHLARLEQVPRRIECIDISNFQGSDIVGAVTVFQDGEPVRSAFRTHPITSTDGQDDFGAIREVVRRRIARVGKGEPLPDLLVIDGGAMQLQAAYEALQDKQVRLPVIALAKERTERDVTNVEVRRSTERIFLVGEREPILLEPGGEVTRLLQRVRDETHNTVISSHRRSRTRRTFRSQLDDIPGVGPDRRRRLLSAFGSVEKIRDVPPDELARAGRMPRALALKILAALRAR